jgi:mitochondrial fission protein ELM1
VPSATHTRPLSALLISDGKPGHHRQSEGVVAAIARLRPVTTTCLTVDRRWLVPSRTLLQCVNYALPPPAILRIGYRLAAHALPRADIVVSSGGETLAANVAAAELLSVANVFSGRMRRLAPARVSVNLVSLERLATHPNALVCLPPSPIAPLAGRVARRLGRHHPPRHLGVLIGGNSGSYRFRPADWRHLTEFVTQAHRAVGLAVLATTSRRSDRHIAEALAALARAPGSGIETFIDYRQAGPGTLAEIYAAADAILCTDDSTAMISEAIGACLPVVAVRPASGRLAGQEREYRDLLAARGWYRPLPLAELTVDTFLTALEEITPPASGPLDTLARELARRLPQLRLPHGP